jgi:hypothetical protein
MVLYVFTEAYNEKTEPDSKFVKRGKEDVLLKEQRSRHLTEFGG